MDPATISALLLGIGGIVGAIATYRSGASKSDLDRVTLLLTSQDKRIVEQQERLTEAYKQIDQHARDQRIANTKIDEQQDQLRQATYRIEDLQQQVNRANRRIRELQHERDVFQKALNDAGVPIPEITHDDPPAH